MRRMLKEKIQGLISKTGYTLIHNHRLAQLKSLEHYKPRLDVWNEHLSRLLKHHAVDCILDVGAADGLFARRLREDIGYKGWIFSFEPVPQLAKALEKLAEGDDKWQVDCCAVGKASGKEPFNVMSTPGFSSFLTPLDDQLAKYSDSNRINAQIEVEVRTVDQIWSQVKTSHGLNRLFLKNTAPGYEIVILEGATACQPEMPLVQVNINFHPIHHGTPSYHDSISAYAKAGYKPSFILPDAYDHSYGIVECLALFTHA